MSLNTTTPNNLDEAVFYLIEEMVKLPNNMQFLDSCAPGAGSLDGRPGEKRFLGTTHHGFGTGIRNNWNLWWTEKGAKEYPSWPQEKPAIVKYFNDLGIYHADDMSGIILTTLYRRYFKLNEDLDGQVKHYQEFWAKQGIDSKKLLNED